MGTVITKDSKYLVKPGKILKACKITDKEKFFEIALPDGRDLGHAPGQFVEVSLFGVGEAPLSLSSSPTKKGSFDLCVREVGKLSAALHRLEAGEQVGIRGPFGKGFPIKIMEGSDLLLVAGGLGIVPLRSLINYVLDNRRDFGEVHLLLGCKTSREILFGSEVAHWEERTDVNFACTIDKADPDWKGNVGLITSLIPGVDLDPERTFAAVVGPPIMYRFVLLKLLEKKIPERQILLSLERHMKCGLGKCGHCQIGGTYCCQEGPVFSYDKIKNIPEAL